MRARTALVLAAVVLLMTAGCGDDDTGDPGGAGGLPPGDDAGLAEVFQPFFDPLGLEFTYGSVDDLGGGKHLALYVEPTGPATDEQYLERLVSSTAAIVPYLFEEFPGLNSFDVCQEPVPTGAGDPEKPEPRTVVLLFRSQAASVDWPTATLADLIRASRLGTGGDVRVDAAIAQLPAWTAAEAAVDAEEETEADDEPSSIGY